MRLAADLRSDPENLYQEGTVMAFAGKSEAAIHLIRELPSSGISARILAWRMIHCLIGYERRQTLWNC